ncbi:MAG: oligopeptide transport system substrate-binding protein [Myxococcota bacterium]|jgi:oligopeptide transport system substrate-binding protein
MFSIPAISLLIGCTPDRLPESAGHTTPVYGGTFQYADEDDIRTLDPAIGYDTSSWTAGHLVFNTLLDYDDDVKLIGSLAESWEISDDGLLWTFHLRSGVRFHDWTDSAGTPREGRELVASDVIASWSRLFDPKIASPGADFFGIIAGSQAVLDGEAATVSGLLAPDADTLQVTLTAPAPTFANAVAMMFGAVVLPEAVADRGDRWAYSPVGTGPFAVEEWRIGERTVFAAHRGYWEDGLPYLDRIIHLAGFPRAVQFLKLEAGELHQLDRLTSPDYLWIKRSAEWSPRLTEIPSVDTYAEMMNTEVPPFDNVWFRRAVSTAIDRSRLKQLRNNRQRSTVSWVPPGIAGFVAWEDLSEEDRGYFQYQRYDPKLSAECLEKAGYPDGYPEPIPYWALNDEASLTTAQSVQQDLAVVGIPIEIRNTTFPAYLTATGKRGEVAMGYGAWVMDYPDPSNFLETKFHCDSRADENSVNDSFYCNREVDAFLDAAAVEGDAEKRTALYHQAHRIIASEAPYAFEYHSTAVSVVQPWVRNFRVHPVWPRDMSRAWLDLPQGRATP